MSRRNHWPPSPPPNLSVPRCGLLAIDMMVWNTEEASGWWDPLQPLDGATMGWVGFDGASALVGISVWAPWWEVSRGFSETVLAFPILALASAQPKL